MASGHPDYWLRVAPNRAIIGDSQLSYNQYNIETIASETTADVFTYSVPAGYYLYVTGMIFSASIPGRHLAAISYSNGGANIIWFYFSLFESVQESIIMRIEGGNDFSLQLRNNDPDIQGVFSSVITGFLDQI